MTKKILIVLISILIVLLIACSNGTGDLTTPLPTSSYEATATNDVTNTPEPSQTPAPTGTITPTEIVTQAPTATTGKTATPTPSPTPTPTPKPTPTPTPEPVDYVSFSHKAGFYNKAFDLTLTAKAGYTIYYTVDNSNPTTKSNKYGNPIKITDKSSQEPTSDKTTVIRAAAFQGNVQAGPIYTYTYIVNSGSNSFENRYNMPVISISTDNANLYDQTKGIFINYTGRGRDWERPCHIEFFETNGKLAFSQDAGIRVYGGTSRANPLKSLKLYARKEYDNENGKFKHTIFPERKDMEGKIVDRYDTFILRAGGNDNIFGGSFASFLRDGLVHHLAGKIEKIDYMEFRPAVVYINGVYWGILNIRDCYDDDYIEQHYGLDKEKLALISYGHEDGRWEYEIDEGTDADLNNYKDMLNFIRNFDMSNSSYYKRASDMLDIDNFIKYMAINIFANNRDWPHNNVKMWKYTGTPGSKYGEDGRWRFMLKDIDYAWGRYDGSSGGAVSVVAEETNHNRDVLSGGGGELGSVLGSLMRNNQFKTKFVNFMCDLTNSYFSSVTIQTTVTGIKNQIAPEMRRALLNTWLNRQPSLTYDAWEANVQRLIDYGNVRPYVMRNTVREVLGLSSQLKVNIKIENPSYGNVVINTVDISGKSTWSGYYFSNTDVPFSVTAKSGYKVSSVAVSGSSVYNSGTLSLKGSSEFTITIRFDKA